MFKLELDLHFSLVGTLPYHVAGVCLTRSLQLPFPPHEGLILFGKDLAAISKPVGFGLRDVVWDIDRGAFLATAGTDEDLRIGMIANTIRGWIDRGWSLGSYADSYPTMVPRQEGTKRRKRHPVDRVDWDDLERMQVTPAADNPKWYVEEYRALVRVIADGGSPSTAYAMDRTGVLSGHTLATESRHQHDPRDVEWNSTFNKFASLSAGAQRKWRAKVKRYPTLRTLLGE